MIETEKLIVILVDDNNDQIIDVYAPGGPFRVCIVRQESPKAQTKRVTEQGDLTAQLSLDIEQMDDRLRASAEEAGALLLAHPDEVDLDETDAKIRLD